MYSLVTCKLVEEQEGCIFNLHVQQKSLDELSITKLFLSVGVPDVITPFKFGDDRFKGYGLAAVASIAPNLELIEIGRNFSPSFG